MFCLGRAGWGLDEIQEFFSTPIPPDTTEDIITIAGEFGWHLKDFKKLSPKQIRHLALLISESRKRQNDNLRDNA